jgi:hypothetical protein
MSRGEFLVSSSDNFITVPVPARPGGRHPRASYDSHPPKSFLGQGFP